MKNLVFFSIVWSIGCSLDEGSRKKFNLFFYNLVYDPDDQSFDDD